MKIEIGEFEVYESGTVIGVLNQPIKFFIEDLLFELIFNSDSVDLTPRIKTEEIVPNGLRIIYINYNNSLGIGNITPARLGFIKGKDLFFSARVYSLQGETGKTIHYTWLLKAKQNV